MTTAIVLLVAWGVGAFGAVYPWAYAPLLAGAAAVGLWGLLTTPRDATTSRALGTALLAVGVAVVLQVLPLPRSVLQSVSPEAVRLLRQYSLQYAAYPGWHSLSINPRRTLLGLGFFVCFSLCLAGVSRHLSREGTDKLATALVVIGLAVALVGIVQRASHINGRVYGFWTPRFRGDIFGPFVNKNHFAGWMLMALPVTLGDLGGRLATGMRNVGPGWRRRIAWGGSSEASALLLVAAAATIMMLSLLLTHSRSAMGALTATLFLSLWLALSKQAHAGRRIVAGVTLLLIAWLAISAADFSSLADQFSGARNSSPIRLAIWRDALHISSMFPVAGTGFNTFGVATIFYQTVPIDLHFVEAHNDYLQLAAEGGLLVGVPVTIAIAVFMWAIWRRLRERGDSVRGASIRTGAVLGIVAIGMQEFLEFSLQIPGNAMLFTVLCAIALHSAPANAGSSRATHRRSNGHRLCTAPSHARCRA